MINSLETACQVLLDAGIPTVIFSMNTHPLPNHKKHITLGVESIIGPMLTPLAENLKSIVLNYLVIDTTLSSSLGDRKSVVVDMTDNTITIIPRETPVLQYFRNSGCKIIRGTATARKVKDQILLRGISFDIVDGFRGQVSLLQEKLRDLEKIALRFYTKWPPNHLEADHDCILYANPHDCTINVSNTPFKPSASPTPNTDGHNLPKNQQ